MTTNSPRKIHVTLSAYEGDDFPNADDLFENYVLAELHRQHPNAHVEISTAQGSTRMFVDGEPNQDLAQEIGSDWWSAFCEAS
jgi:hypothetical protein